jgi:biopolymer transport protein TolR
MAVSIDGGGGYRRKPLDAELNLVPYIDLLTCMVAFLLITAVWVELARLEVRQRGQGDQVETDTHHVDITVMVNGDGFVLIAKEDQKPLPRKNGDLDFGGLAGELKNLKRVYADKTDVQIASEDGVTFDVLVKTMDAALGAGFPDVSLVDAAGAGR